MRSIRKLFYATNSHLDLHMIYLYVKEKSEEKREIQDGVIVSIILQSTKQKKKKKLKK
jgi:hypothetical protein